MVPAPGFEIDVDVAAGLLDDAVDGGEAEPGPLPHLLGGEERLEDLLLHLRRHAGAGVGDFEEHVVAGLEALFLELRALRGRHVGGADLELAAVGHRVARVDGKVHDHLLELIEVGLDRPDVAPVGHLELDRLAEEAREEHRDVGERLVEIDDGGPQRLPPRERQQLADETGRAIGVLLDVHDVLEGRVGRPVRGQEQVGEADDRGQHVVEVVRDAAGELADRLHLLALRELQLERALLGRLERIDDRGVLALVAFQDRRDEEARALLGQVRRARRRRPESRFGRRSPR